MPAKTRSETSLQVRLPADLKAVIEEAAATLGQSVSDYAIATLVQHARQVTAQQHVTELTARDRDRFIALLDQTDAKPNQSLKEAARRYKKHLGRSNGHRSMS